MGMMLNVENEKTRGRGKQSKAEGDACEIRSLRLNPFKGHFGLSVYTGVTSTTNGNC